MTSGILIMSNPHAQMMSPGGVLPQSGFVPLFWRNPSYSTHPTSTG